MEGIGEFGGPKAMVLKKKPGAPDDSMELKDMRQKDSLNDDSDSSNDHDEDDDDDASGSDDSDSEDDDDEGHKKGTFHLVRNSKIYTFVADDIEWTVITVCAHLIIWAYGAPLWYIYGYGDEKDDLTLNQNEQEGLPSGPNGSGALVVSTVIMMLTSVVWIIRYAMYDPVAEHPEMEEFHSFKSIFFKPKKNRSDSIIDEEFQHLNSQDSQDDEMNVK